MWTASLCVASFTAVLISTKFIERLKAKKYKKLQLRESRKSLSRPVFYNEYCMTVFEKVRYIALADIVIFSAGYLFFRNILLCFCLCIFSFFYPKIKTKNLIKARKIQLSLQFKDALNSIASSLSAGRSVESAFKAAAGELALLYSGENAYIINELDLINRKVEMNETLASALEDFAMRADIDDIKNFVDVFAICKNTGGNLVEVMKNTAAIISQKIDIRNEINIIVAEQHLNQRILSIMPFALMTIIILSSPDYVEPLYTPVGNIIMFIVLSLIIGAYFIGKKIMDIKV